eukprot:jgi/Chrpa1/7444/Chrysochromulina_OHIO_Genome00000277-RA
MSASGPANASEPEAVRLQHEKELKQLRDTFTARLEGFAGEVLDSYLAGHDWESAFASFFAEHCYVFARFSAAAGDFELRMTAIHEQFLVTLDGLLDVQLARLDLSAERAARLLNGGSGGNDCGVCSKALVEARRRLDRLSDFVTFGEMMRERHEQRLAAVAAASTSRAASSTSETAVRHTRVLWDFENVGVPSGIDPFEAVCALERWLEARGLWGAGIDSSITAFFEPDSVGRPLRKALDRAGVEQVLASSKREDADRKLNARLERDLALLPSGAATAAVFITSDTDFIPQLRRLKQRGGPTVLLTTAPHGSQHYSALALAATETHSWQAIVRSSSSGGQTVAAASKSVGSIAVVDGGGAPGSSAAGSSDAGSVGGAGFGAALADSASGSAKDKAASVAAADASVPTTAPGISSSPPPSSQYKAGVRYEAKCTYWDGRGGWGRLAVQDGGTLFVHNTALRAGCGHGKRRSLRRGDLVSCAVGSNTKGPLAIDVELVARAAGADEEVDGIDKDDAGAEGSAGPDAACSSAKGSEPGRSRRVTRTAPK